VAGERVRTGRGPVLTLLCIGPFASHCLATETLAGHPGDSTLNLYERFIQQLILAVQKHPKIRQSTAIFITTDEGGGYYDSGYIQVLDFFGDGTRVPLIVVSPHAKIGDLFDLFDFE